MRKLTLLAIAALMVTSAGLTLQADLSGCATATVYAIVDPNCTVGVNTAVVQANGGNAVQTGDFCATISFRIDANLQSLYLYAAASPLFKGDDPTNDEVAPIPLDLSAGVVIAPTNANPMAGGSNVASFTEATMIDAFPAMQTEMICFESSQNNHFSQDVLVTVCWTQDDPEKPTGEYSGKVKLCCVLMPEAPTAP